jgi:DNA-directed RNA polymerase subunit N (RpoN/RPB10)
VVGSWTPTVRERFAALGPMRCGCGADLGYAWEPFHTQRSQGASMQDALAHALRDNDKKHICARIALMTAVDWPAMHELFDLHARW